MLGSVEEAALFVPSLFISIEALCLGQPALRPLISPVLHRWHGRGGPITDIKVKFTCHADQLLYVEWGGGAT